MNLTPDEMKLVEQMRNVFRAAGCKDLERNLSSMMKPTPDAVKPCPFCGCIMRTIGEGVVEHHARAGCPLQLLVFPLDKWNRRTP